MVYSDVPIIDERYYFGALLYATQGAVQAQPGGKSANGKVFDCKLQCVNEATARRWIGDNYCDNGKYGMYLVCSAFSYMEEIVETKSIFSSFF